MSNKKQNFQLRVKSVKADLGEEFLNRLFVGGVAHAKLIAIPSCYDQITIPNTPKKVKFDGIEFKGFDPGRNHRYFLLSAQRPYMVWDGLSKEDAAKLIEDPKAFESYKWRIEK